ncbi:MAG: citrate lyase subunit beta / citryl-CoA lyase [Gammaproteobacteria bacterium]|nr:citrate lyase subunit beta / citryl-CoA lyase [Gammaproteobacteria bacterium]
MRSKLFVPGSRPELFAKALAGDADAISFDVEDSVPEDAKVRAREQIADFLRSSTSRESLRNKIIIVRVNAVTSRHFEGDLIAFACPQVALLNLPKAQNVADIQMAAATLDRVERDIGLDRPMRLLVNIETPRAVRQACELADAHPRVAGLQLGLTDLFESLRIDRQDMHSVHAGMFAVRLASGESGRFTYDSAFPDVADEGGFRREAELARRMGYIGKSCVHPKQVAIANEIFRVDELQLESARRIVAAAREAAAAGRGAFLLDGRMIDLPIIKRAEALLAAANEAAPLSR